MTVRNSLVFWDNLKLLDHKDFSQQAALDEKRRREFRSRNRMPWRLGYTEMPKTIDCLIKAAAYQRQEKTGSQWAAQWLLTQDDQRAPKVTQTLNPLGDG